MRYEEPVFRPPSEALSLIIQATIGCSYNKCTFCGMYKGKSYRERDVDEIKEDIIKAKEYYGDVKRLFLADGNALAMETSKFLEIMEFANNIFNLDRISAYATPIDLLEKSEEELIRLRNAGLELLYVGIESGDDEILKEVRKGVNSAQIVEGCKKAIKCGIDLSVTVITGLGGKKKSYNNAKNTAKVINQIKPRYTAALTLIPIPNTALYKKIEKREFELLNPTENLTELKWFVEDVECKTIFRCNHASNYFPIGGTLPYDKDKIIKAINYAINNPKVLKPEFLRGL
ncbi:radical SAM protein [Archaeoglobales archaeon]|nr:MAG: radical SAM protein [Archaeoglobales archaeon]